MKLLLGTMILVSSMSWAGAKEDKKEPGAEMARLEAEIKTLSADKSCNQNEDCDKVGMGNRLCGGPAYFEVFSKLHTNTATMQKLAEQHRKAAQEFNKTQNSGMVGICAMAPVPEVFCQSGQCVAKKAKMRTLKAF
ncbi:MAG: hypothetical protein KDD33_00600 [Bdellovibrionales bacterium]|nr:hypothetical protein [Bdellovibrionales bacterium]